MTTPALRLVWHTDPGHGWLEVPRVALDMLAVADRITGYSYQSRDGRLVYLEEDCDAPTFLEAWRDRYGSEPYVAAEVNYPAEDAPLRALPHFPGRR